MSLMIELVALAGGAMSEYAQQKRWGSLKIFTATFSLFFIILTLYFLLFPPAKGFLGGLICTALLGLGLGLVNVLLIRHAIRRKRELSDDTVAKT